MKITFWGTRGSLPSAGPETQYFGGNTPCLEVRSGEHLLVLDAGSGIRRLGMNLPRDLARVDLLLTHLHMDHIQGLGFFQPIFNPATQVHIYGPASRLSSLNARLNRYLSPPLFPVPIRELPSQLHFHEVPSGSLQIGPFRIRSEYVTHPGPTVGYRIEVGKASLAYIPDHEPAMRNGELPCSGNWTSGYNLAHKADLLVHDAQFYEQEYSSRVGWGHSTIQHALEFARLTEVGRLSLFHHDPSHPDEELDQSLHDAVRDKSYSFAFSLAREGETIELPGGHENS